MNSNLFHNLVNIATLLIAMVTAILVATGCVEGPDGSLSCEGSFIPVEWTTWLIAALMAIKMLVNIARDGLSGLTKKQPPVQ